MPLGGMLQEDPAEGPEWRMATPETTPVAPAATAVLDTNVLLDWLVFRNPDCAALVDAVSSGAVRWIATRAMREEMAHVLARGHLDTWSPDLPAIWSAWDRHAVELPVPPPPSLATRLRCTDPDDQKFIDLAVACQAAWLLSRDRAVLNLRRRLSAHGVSVLTPDRWRALEGEA